MKRNALLTAGLLLLIAFAILGVSLHSPAKKGALETWSELHDGKVGSVYVLGRYDGFLNGWDVAFFSRNDQGQWLGYYLAHEVRHWRQPNLQIEGNVVIVNDGSKRVAEYDPIAGTLAHKLQGVTYSRKDGLDGGVEVAKWNLASAQGPK